MTNFKINDDVNFFWYLSIPTIIIIVITFISLILKTFMDNFFSWISIILVLVSFFSVLLIVSVIMYYKEKYVTDIPVTNDLNPQEATLFMIEFAKKEPLCLSLELMGGTRRVYLCKSVGTGSQRTEVYVRKFVDESKVNRMYHYMFMRRTEPDTISIKSYDYEPNEAEEERIIEKVSNDLALTPIKVKTNRIERMNHMTGISEKIITSEPVESHEEPKKDDGKEDIEE